MSSSIHLIYQGSTEKSLFSFFLGGLRTLYSTNDFPGTILFNNDYVGYPNCFKAGVVLKRNTSNQRLTEERW